LISDVAVGGKTTLFLPYEGNEDDLTCYVKMVNDQSKDFRRTYDGWVNVHQPTIYPPIYPSGNFEFPMTFDQYNSQKFFWVDVTNKHEYTENAFQTQVSTATARSKLPYMRDCIAQVKTGFILVHQALDGGDPNHKAWFSSDWKTFVEHTGNLDAMFGAGGGGSWEERGRIRNMTPDFLSGQP